MEWSKFRQGCLLGPVFGRFEVDPKQWDGDNRHQCKQRSERETKSPSSAIGSIVLYIAHACNYKASARL